MKRTNSESLSTIGLFAGIGGIELGLSRAGHRAQMICEIDPGATAVLERHFGLHVAPDVRKLRPFPKVDLIAAGFPCQDLSQAGRTAGIVGSQSGLIDEVFKRLRSKSNGPRWLLMENVPFMLQLQRGKAMRYLVDELEALGFTWAYRVVDARAFRDSAASPAGTATCVSVGGPTKRFARLRRWSAIAVVFWNSALRILLDRGSSGPRLGCRCGANLERWIDDRDPVAPGYLGSGRWVADDPRYSRRGAAARFQGGLDHAGRRSPRRSSIASLEARWERGQRAGC